MIYVLRKFIIGYYIRKIEKYKWSYGVVRFVKDLVIYKNTFPT